MSFRSCASVTGATPVGAVDEETIKRYIEGQKWDDAEGFKITAPSKP